MKGLITVAPREMSLQDLAEPGTPKPGYVLLQVVAVGMCGSDYGLYLGSHPLAEFPRIQGHEFSARILEYGTETQKLLPVGALVAVEPLVPCGHCYPCRNGKYNCCETLQLFGVHVDGGLEKYVAVPEKLIHSAEGIDEDLAAFSEPMSIALQGVRRGNVKPGEFVLVMGAGPVGQAAIIAATDLGARVAALDIVDERLELARGSGAELALNSSGPVASEIRAWSGGDGPAIIIDATGAPAALDAAIELVAASGRIVMIGISDKTMAVPIAAMTRKELTILGSRNSAGIFAEAVNLVRRNQNKISALVTHKIGLAQVADTIELALRDPKSVEKIIVRLAE